MPPRSYEPLFGAVLEHGSFHAPNLYISYTLMEGPRNLISTTGPSPPDPLPVGDPVLLRRRLDVELGVRKQFADGSDHALRDHRLDLVLAS